MVYIGFSYVAAHHSLSLEGTTSDQLLGRIGQIVLGHHAGLVVCMSIALTCLTTAIALTVVCAEFLQKKISKNRLSYEWSLVAVLVITTFISTLEFTGIVKLLAPILEVVYPSMLVLCLMNIFHKTLNYKPVKAPVFVTISLVLYIQYFT